MSASTEPAADPDEVTGAPPRTQVRVTPAPDRAAPSRPAVRGTSMRERELAARRRRMRNRSLAADFHAQRLRQDRWNWRRRIRRNPRKRAFYRALIGVLGTLFICLGLITGPLPGPGGIPLVLLGLAIWASEFHWAHKLMVGFKVRLKQYLAWSLRQKVLFWAVFAVCCWVLAYTYLVVIGPPGWVPQSVDALLTRLPGV